MCFPASPGQVKGIAVTTGFPEPEDLLGGRSVSVKRVAGGKTVMLAFGDWLPDASLLEATEDDVLALSVKVVVDVKTLVSVLLTMNTFLTPTVV